MWRRARDLNPRGHVNSLHDFQSCSFNQLGQLSMAPQVGFEPTTDRLTADCSTTELLWNNSKKIHLDCQGYFKINARRVARLFSDVALLASLHIVAYSMTLTACPTTELLWNNINQAFVSITILKSPAFSSLFGRSLD